MGSQSSAQKGASFRKEDWQLVQKRPQVSIWQNKQEPRLKIQEYNVVAQSENEFKHEKDMFYLRRNSSLLVTAYYLSQYSKDQYCSSHQRLSLFLQRIPVRLNDIQHVPFPDYLHLYNNCLRGYMQLSQLGYFNVEQQLIGINENGVAKVWLNEDYSKSVINANSVAQQRMVWSIIDVIDKSVDHSQLPRQIPSVKNFLYRNSNSINFEFAIRQLQQFARLFNSSQIPLRLDCVDKVGGIQVIANRQKQTILQQYYEPVKQERQLNRYFSNEANQSIYYERQNGYPSLVQNKNNLIQTNFINPQCQNSSYQPRNSQITPQGPVLQRQYPIYPPRKQNTVSNLPIIMNGSTVNQAKIEKPQVIRQNMALIRKNSTPVMLQNHSTFVSINPQISFQPQKTQVRSSQVFNNVSFNQIPQSNQQRSTINAQVPLIQTKVINYQSAQPPSVLQSPRTSHLVKINFQNSQQRQPSHLVKINNFPNSQQPQQQLVQSLQSPQSISVSQPSQIQFQQFIQPPQPLQYISPHPVPVPVSIQSQSQSYQTKFQSYPPPPPPQVAFQQIQPQQVFFQNPGQIVDKDSTSKSQIMKRTSVNAPNFIVEVVPGKVIPLNKMNKSTEDVQVKSINDKVKLDSFVKKTQQNIQSAQLVQHESAKEIIKEIATTNNNTVTKIEQPIMAIIEQKNNSQINQLIQSQQKDTEINVDTDQHQQIIQKRQEQSLLRLNSRPIQNQQQVIQQDKHQFHQVAIESENQLYQKQDKQENSYIIPAHNVESTVREDRTSSWTVGNKQEDLKNVPFENENTQEISASFNPAYNRNAEYQVQQDQFHSHSIQPHELQGNDNIQSQNKYEPNINIQQVHSVQKASDQQQNLQYLYNNMDPSYLYYFKEFLIYRYNILVNGESQDVSSDYWDEYNQFLSQYMPQSDQLRCVQSYPAEYINLVKFTLEQSWNVPQTLEKQIIQLQQALEKRQASNNQQQEVEYQNQIVNNIPPSYQSNNQQDYSNYLPETEVANVNLQIAGQREDNDLDYKKYLPQTKYTSENLYSTEVIERNDQFDNQFTKGYYQSSSKYANYGLEDNGKSSPDFVTKLTQFQTKSNSYLNSNPLGDDYKTYNYQFSSSKAQKIDQTSNYSDYLRNLMGQNTFNEPASTEFKPSYKFTADMLNYTPPYSSFEQKQATQQYNLNAGQSLKQEKSIDYNFSKVRSDYLNYN